MLKSGFQNIAPITWISLYFGCIWNHEDCDYGLHTTVICTWQTTQSQHHVVCSEVVTSDVTDTRLILEQRGHFRMNTSFDLHMNSNYKDMYSWLPYLYNWNPRRRIPITKIRSHDRLYMYIDGSVQDCSDSIANVLELLPSCTKPSISVQYMSPCGHYWNYYCGALSLSQVISYEDRTPIHLRVSNLKMSCRDLTT